MLWEQFIRPSLKAMRTLLIRSIQGYGNTASLSYPDTWMRKPDCLHLPYKCFDLFFHLGHFFVLVSLFCSKGRSVRYSPGQAGQPMSLHCGTVCGGRVQEGTMPLAQLSVAFSHFLCYLQANWDLLVLIPGWVVLCML